MTSRDRDIARSAAEGAVAKYKGFSLATFLQESGLEPRTLEADAAELGWVIAAAWLEEEDA